MAETQKQPPEKAVLDPDHPLLKRFQEALKEHYLFQINRLKSEIFEYETDTKKINDEREQLGVQTYELQQMVCRQQKTLEEIVNEAQTMASARIEMENKLQEEKMKYKESQEKLIEAEKSNLELQNEISSVNLLINQVSILTHSSKSLLIILNVGVSMGEKNRVQHNSESAHSRKNA